MKAIILLLAVAVLAMGGCGSIAKKVVNIDQDISTIMKSCEPDKPQMSINCRAGLAQGFLIAPDSTAGVRASAEALKSVADPSSEAYKCCYGGAAWISFLIHGTDDLVDKSLTKIIGLGLF